MRRTPLGVARLGGFSRRIDFGFHLSIVEASGEFLALQSIPYRANNPAACIHGNGIASRQGRAGAQGAEKGGMSLEHGFVLTQACVCESVEGFAVECQAVGKG